jgi:hypothetical protein
MIRVCVMSGGAPACYAVARLTNGPPRSVT